MDKKTVSKKENPAQKPVKDMSGNENICENLNFAAKEAFKRLRTNVAMFFADNDTGRGNVVGITSAQPSEGKSTVSINLAWSLAALGKKVLLVDADLRRPSVHTKTLLELSPGISNLLSDTNEIGSVIKPYPNASEGMRFDIITAGAVEENASEILNSKRTARLLQVLAGAYDYVVLDLPPVGTVIDAVSVSRNVDGMIVVVRENHCPRGVLAEAVEQLKFANVNILGFVVNGALDGAGKRSQYNYKYY